MASEMPQPPPLIYLDHNATTPVDAQVLEKMLPFFTSTFGNPASRDHPQGWLANDAVRTARSEVAHLIGAQPHEITFTSGATESINLLLRGHNHPQPDLPILTLKTEHSAVVETCHALEREGSHVKWIGVDSGGRVDLEAWEKALQAGAQLAVVLWVNHETGVVQDMEAIGLLCQHYKVPLFTDATQAAGKLPIDLNQHHYIDYACCSSHKIHGPKGIGGLYIRQGSPNPLPQLAGGGQENGLRSGTLNVPAIVGFGKAAKLANHFISSDKLKQIADLRDQLERGLLALGNVLVNGFTAHRVPHVSNLLFKGILAEDLIMAVNHRLAISTGSACNSMRVLPSHILLAMGRTETEAFSSLRFSLGRHTTEEEVRTTLKTMAEAVRSLV